MKREKLLNRKNALSWAKGLSGWEGEDSIAPHYRIWEASRDPLPGAYQICRSLGVYHLIGVRGPGQTHPYLFDARNAAEADYAECMKETAAKFALAVAMLPKPKETEDA